MIRCSAFCISLTERTAEAASRAAERIDRLSEGVSRVKLGREGGSETEAVLVALQNGKGEGLPVVHGFASESADGGEFSMVLESGDTLEARRDAAGSRPLYVGASGEWVASDHRFFPEEEKLLLPPQARYDVFGRKRTSAAWSEEPLEGSFAEAAERLARNLELCVKERVVGRGKVAVAFSGGLDSSILAWCASKYARVVACTVHSPRSLDKVKAARAADLLGIQLEDRVLEKDGVASELAGLDLPFQAGPMDRSLWCIYSVASKAAADSGAELIILGQLADELFGGYAKYESEARERGPESAKKLMARDVQGCGMRGLIRDEAACSRWLEPRFPFADGRVLRLGLSAPAEFCFRGGERKSLLREAARRLGMPEELTATPKKAAQYSSGILKLVD